MISHSSEYDPMTNQLPNHQLERFRGWSLTALYFALALWAVVFCFATVKFWDLLVEQAGGTVLVALLLMAAAAATFLTSARAGDRFLRAMRAKGGLPRVDLIPFLLIAVTIVIAGRAFPSA